jgi:hypothetical protein
MLYRILLSPEAEGSGAPTEGDRVSIPREEYEALVRSSQAGPEPGPEASSFEERERRLAEREASHRTAVRDRELAVALAGRALVPGAAAQLIKLWRDEFDVYEDDGQYRVVARDGRGVAGAVEDWLASPEYAHFCPPTTRGGTATPGAVSGRPGPGGPDGPPRTLGEMVLRRWRESGARPEPASRPVGLGRRRS